MGNRLLRKRQPVFSLESQGWFFAGNGKNFSKKQKFWLTSQKKCV